MLGCSEAVENEFLIPGGVSKLLNSAARRKSIFRIAATMYFFCLRIFMFSFLITLPALADTSSISPNCLSLHT